MDPTACLTRALTALELNDRDEAVEALRDLANWLERGGFMPHVDIALERVPTAKQCSFPHSD